jgi:thioredoxin 1
MANIVTLTKDNFGKEVETSSEPVLIDFWAGWCGPCRMVAPIVAQIADELDGTVKVGKVDVDDQPELARAFSVMSIPTLVLMKNNVKLTQIVGAQPKAAILNKIREYVQ